jgi:hypothetical protein
MKPVDALETFCILLSVEVGASRKMVSIPLFLEF